jgi:signal transduction histidine kinase
MRFPPRHPDLLRAKVSVLVALHISHELRAPLNAIMGWTELISKFDFDEERMRRAIAVIQRNAAAQKRLVDDLIDISTMLTGKFRLLLDAVDLAAVVESALENARPAAAKKRIELVSSLEDVERVQGDAARLQQILGNLLNNAIKFVPEGGKVMVNREHVAQPAS